MQSARALIDFSVERAAADRQRHPHRRHRGAGLGARAPRPSSDKGGDAARAALALIALKRQRAKKIDVMAKAAQPNEGRRANRRGAARLAAVQALYQMDLAATAAQRDPGRVREPLDRPRGRGRAISAGRGRAIFRDVVGGVVARAAQARSDDRRGAAEGLAAEADRDRAARDPARRRLRARPQAATCRRASSCRNMSMSPMPSSIATRPAWSMRCSTSLRGSCARASSKRLRGDAWPSAQGRRVRQSRPKTG